MLRVKAYNNGNKTMLYSVETYRMGTGHYFAVTSDEMKRVVETSSGQLVSMVRPLSEGETRQDAIDRMMVGIEVMTGIKKENQSFISVRHHEEHACYLCKRLPLFEKYDDWRHHFVEVHTPSSIEVQGGGLTGHFDGIPTIKVPMPHPNP